MFGWWPGVSHANDRLTAEPRGIVLLFTEGRMDIMFLLAFVTYFCPRAPMACLSLMSHNAAVKAWGHSEVLGDLLIAKHWRK